LVVFDCQDVIATADNNLFRDSGLATHGIDGYDRACQGQHREQFGDGSDFVRFLFTGTLAQGQARFGGIGGNLMQSPQAAPGTPGAAQGFTVNGDDAPNNGRTDSRHPLLEAGFQLNGREHFEYSPDGVVPRNAVAQS
jgi:hypothetical protein